MNHMYLKRNLFSTDQCRAMEVAIANVWKETVHCWCKWHVLKRVSECVGLKYTQNRDFRDKFHKMLNEMLTIDEFESEWQSLLKEYDLEGNTFLKQIYETRSMWVKSYFKGVFCARMSSTQRSESANMMLKNIVPPSYSLHVFVDQYAKLQYIRIEEENYEEKRSKKVTQNVFVLHLMIKFWNKFLSNNYDIYFPQPRSDHYDSGPLGVDASRLYHPKVFALFCDLKAKSEFYRAFEVVPGRKYEVVHYDRSCVERWCKGTYTVTVSDNGKNYEFQCGLFEHFGLPCCHIIQVTFHSTAMV